VYPNVSAVRSNEEIRALPLADEEMQVPPLPMKKYMCLICGWIYDEAEGAPEEGIAPGTRWEDVPPNWTCPECGARKEDFEMVEF
jgi:rubredoxin